MTMFKSGQPIGIWIITFVAVAFGLLTIKSGGSVIFIDGVAREAAGNYVPIVIWFNFLAGFFYILAGVGLLMKKRWAAWTSVYIVVATVIIFSLLGLHILNDGLYEVRTVMAMVFRTVVWAVIAIFSYLIIIRQN